MNIIQRLNGGPIRNLVIAVLLVFFIGSLLIFNIRCKRKKESFGENSVPILTFMTKKSLSGVEKFNKIFRKSTS